MERRTARRTSVLQDFRPRISRSAPGVSFLPSNADEWSRYYSMRWFMRIAVSAERSRSQRACPQPRQSDSAARVFGIYSVKLRDQATLTPLISLYPVALGLTSAVNVSAYLVVLVGS